jgi:peptidoglycan biosynthesis protein MviN/MurJ (putative lipid II flippase)
MNDIRTGRVSTSRARLAAGGWSLAGNLVGALLPYVIVLVVANTAVTDAYFIASTVMLFVAHLLATCVEAVLVPYGVRTQMHVGSRLRHLLWMRPIRNLLLLSVCGGVIAAVVASVWLAASSDGLAAIPREVSLSLMALVGLPAVSTLSGIVGSGLHAQGRFGLTNATRGLRSLLAAVLVITLGDEVGVLAAAVGLLGGELLRATVLITAHRRMFRFRTAGTVAAFEAERERSPSLWRWFAPHLMAASAASAMSLVDVAVASWLGRGAVTVLVLAEKAYAGPLVLVTACVCSVSGAVWSQGLQRGSSWTWLKQDYLAVQRDLARWSVPGALLGCCALPILLWVGLVESLVGTALETELVLTVAILLIAVPLAAWTTVATRLLVVVGETRRLPRLTIGALVMNLVASVLLAWPLGVVGIALGTLAVRVGTAMVHHRVALSALDEAKADQHDAWV